jgi:hypothetical protein
MNEKVREQLIAWAYRVEAHTDEGWNPVKAQDLIHDIVGIMRDDEHFLPRL